MRRVLLAVAVLLTAFISVPSSASASAPSATWPSRLIMVQSTNLDDSWNLRRAIYEVNLTRAVHLVLVENCNGRPCIVVGQSRQPADYGGRTARAWVGSTIVSANVWMNSSLSRGSPSTRRAYLTHELLHAVGMAHREGGLMSERCCGNGLRIDGTTSRLLRGMYRR